MSQNAFTAALFAIGVILTTIGWFVRQTLAEVRDFGRRMDKVHQTVFGPNGDNGLYGDNTQTKRRLHRLHGFAAAVCLWLGMDCDDDGRVTWLDGTSPFERRLDDRRKTPDRRT